MSDCDYGPGAWEEVVRPVDQRRHVAQEQTAEATRLAHDHALLQPGTWPDEISTRRIADVKSVIAAWNRTLHELEKRRRRS